MCTKAQALEILQRAYSMCNSALDNCVHEAYLYGSYARGDFGKDSDVDIMVLVDLPEEKLNSFSDELSELGFEYNVMHDIWFMPVVKNMEHFQYWCQAYPFYSNVAREGISLYETA